ncbi:UDP-glucuronosyltransferase 2A1-like [Pholidichthys leucotaenia]
MFLTWRVGKGGTILIVPLEGSHWVNMDIMIKALHSRGHSVDVVRTNKSWYIKDDSLHYKTVTVPVSETFNQDFVNPIIRKVVNTERGKSMITSFMRLQLEMFTAMFDIHGMMCNMATTMFEDKEMMAKLQARRYDMVLTDPAWGAGILLSYALKVPLVYNVRWVTSGEGHLELPPSPLSYIPMTGSRLSDKMTFMERVKNHIFYIIWQFQDTFLIRPQYQAVCDKFFGPKVRYKDLLQGADLWLMRVDFVFEFPRPTMPNIIYIGCFQCQPSKPLPEHLEEFVQSSGEHGVIIMFLGTFVSELPADITNVIAATFAKIPQKVIWNYRGDRPATLGNNTLLVNWMPQNDLLGHPRVKLFVAHGGTNGVQEAIYHGVPVLGIPVFFDQYDNLLRLKERGAAKILTLATTDKDDNFFKAVQEVLNEPSYRMNMQRLSRLHRDQPMKPLDTAIFWIEFVMRHKGAAHLRTESYKLPWYSYYSVDVLLFFLVSVTVITFVSFVFFSLMCVFLTWRVGKGGTILIVPLEGSHWVNMDIMIKALHSRGHSVDVVRTNKSWYIKDDSLHYKTVTVPVSETFNQDFVNPIIRKMVLTDPAWGAGILLSYALKVPLVYNVRWVTSGEGHLEIAPSPLSYIPMTGSRLSDKMTFMERVKNHIFYIIWQFQDMFLIRPQYQAVCDKFFGPKVRYKDLLQGADLWLMRVDFVFEFPRSTMPNIIYIGGFQCQPSKPLPEHLEEFVQSSGEHGVIIMSLGTFVSELPADITNVIAATFAKIPQKVIWNYRGDRPATLGNNTLLVNWMPQNDLLGHPRVKLFVAHGGTNGVQEAIYHGVPVLGIPVFFDQYDNLLRLKERGAAKILTLATTDKDDNFFKAVQEVLNEPSYRMNMQRLSRLHRDQPMKPLDTAIFWIEFVMRHKGAAHLRTESYKLPWYSYYSVDVLLFFLVSVTVITFVSFVFFSLMCGKKRKPDKTIKK